MGRRRTAGRTQYPEGVYVSRGWLFYRDRATGKWPKICRVAEWDGEHPNSKAARARWATLSTGQAPVGTVAAMLDALMAYREQLLRQGKLSKRTYEDDIEYLKPLKAVFGSMLPHEVNGKHVSGYLQKRSWRPRPRRDAGGVAVEQAPQLAPVRANKEISLLSSGFSWAISSPDWPLVSSNPCHGVKRNKTKASERCPEVWEIQAAKAHAPGPWPWILDLAYKAGSRGVQFRQLPKTAIREKGIFIGKAKGGADVYIEWDDELYALALALLDHTAAIEADRHVISPYVIVSRTGSPYTAAGWKTTVYKFVRAAVADQANALEEPFSFHDIRARSATDEEELMGTNPQHRLGHIRRATTDDYMRGKRAKSVKPLPLRKAS